MQATVAHEDDKRAQRSRYWARRRREIAYGRWRPQRDAAAVRAHVDGLRRAGMTLQDIAAAAAARGGHPVAVSTIKALLNGRGAGTAPTRRVSSHVADALLAIEPVDARAAALRALRRACTLLPEPGWPARELRRLMDVAPSPQSDAALRAALQQAVTDAVRARYAGLPGGADLRMAAAARVLRVVLPRSPGALERQAAARALCGPEVNLPRSSVARLLGVSESTLRRDLTAA